MRKLPARLAALPYRIHTNRELGLMLRGAKPLAVFSEPYDQPLDVLERYFRMFDRHVREGNFVKREYVEQLTNRDSSRIRVVLYALPSEEWRIDAMIQLRARPGWSAAQERMEGELLGYQDWQNDIWIGSLPIS